MLRVALDATPLLGTRTGVGTFTSGLLRALAHQQHVDVVAYALSARGARGLRTAVESSIEVIDRPLPAGVLTRLLRRRDWPRAEQLIGTVDVVHGTNYVVPPAQHAGEVVTVYDLTAVRFPEMVEPASLRYPDLVKRAAARGAFVHVTAAAIGEEVVDLLGVSSDRVRVVASGVDAPAAPGDAARGRRLAGACRYVIALGTVEPRKGLPDLVAAFDRVASDASRRDVALVIAGADGWGADELVRAIDASPHRRRIRRLGWVDDRARADLLAGATVLAMPSRYEGFGYPPLEAMAAGTPVVATSVGSLPEVLGDAAMLVPAGDVDAFAESLVALVDDAVLQRQLQDAGRGRAAEFSWDACANAMIELYREASASR
jgi:glycosyltransferase involved in cell wall biosynthesis